MINGEKVPAEEFEKLKKVLEDQSFAAQFSALDTLEEMQSALKEKGVELTPQQIYSAAATIAAEKSDELDESLLEDVAGGISFWIFDIKFVKPKWWPW